MDKLYEKTLACERKYTGRIINVDLVAHVYRPLAAPLATAFKIGLSV